MSKYADENRLHISTFFDKSKDKTIRGCGLGERVIFKDIKQSDK